MCIVSTRRRSWWSARRLPTAIFLVFATCVTTFAKRHKARPKDGPQDPPPLQGTSDAEERNDGKDLYNAAAWNWGFRVKPSSAPVLKGQQTLPSLTPSLAWKAHKAVNPRFLLRGRTSSRARPNLSATLSRNSSVSTEFMQALDHLIAVRNTNKVFTVEGSFLLKYLHSTALMETLVGNRLAPEPGGGPLLQRQPSSTSEQQAASAGTHDDAALDQAAEGSRRLISAAVDTLSFCTSRWGLEREMAKIEWPARTRSPEQCSRKINILIFVDSSYSYTPSKLDKTRTDPSPQRSEWWKKPNLMRGLVLQAELDNLGHYARVVDLSDSQEEPSGLHHEGTGVLVDIHRRHSLDVCLCVGAACKDSMRSTQVHDPADTAGLVEMLGNVKDGDVLLSSSRAMQMAAGAAGGIKSIPKIAQHNNYAGIGQTPYESLGRRMKRVLVQVVGERPPTGESSGERVVAVASRLGRMKDWQVIQGLHRLTNITDYIKHRRAIAEKRNPGGIGETVLGLGRVQAAVLWPHDVDDVAQRCEDSGALFIHLVSAGIPTVVYPGLAILDAAVIRGYPLVATNVHEVAALLMQLSDSPAFRQLASQRGLEIAARHRPTTAADQLARHICDLKKITRSFADEKLLVSVL